MDESTTVRITAPGAELAALSFCDHNPTSLADWVGGLPMANTDDAATRIRQATFEIARLNIDFQARMELLENLRPTLHYLCVRLDQSASTSYGDRTARLAQRLQTNLCSGYKAIIIAALAELADGGVRETISLAIHRTLADLSRNLLRTLQFYVAPADRLWQELNYLYLLAEGMGSADDCWEDQENHSRPETSIRAAYLRSILLALAKPNQLRHKQLSSVFSALEVWSPMVGLDQADTGALFCVDLASEQGPRYSRLLTVPVEPRSVRTEILVHEIEEQLKGDDSSLDMPENFPPDLLHHLAGSWGIMRRRAFKRSGATGCLKICVGLRAAHYFLSGGVEFSDQLDLPDAQLGQEVNPFGDSDAPLISTTNAAEITDVWDQAFDLSVKIPLNPAIERPEEMLNDDAEGKNARGGFHFYDTDKLDTSPGGYRVSWTEPLPSNMQTGELVAVRDEIDPRWCIAVVRWIRQDDQGTSMGIELLSPRAIPIAVRVINKKGGPTDFTRAFLLPELAPIDQPATLVTPPVPFNSGQKVHVLRQGIKTTSQLTECVLKTESFNQFTFRMLDGYLENIPADINMAAIDATTEDRTSGDTP